jgi:hypothetical protein
MAERARSHKQAQLLRSKALRAAGRTWAEVAAVFRAEYGVNARVAMRLAHGWSQGDVAEQWNARWPDDLKTFKNISYWERWPASTGYEPGLDVLAKLAAIYQCHVADLLVDGADHRDEDPVHRSRLELGRLPSAIASAAQRDDDQDDGAVAADGSEALAALINRLEESDVHELARQTAGWAAQLDPAIDRRSLLLKLSFALTLAAAAPAGSVADDDDLSPARAHDDTSDFSGVWRSEYTYYSAGRGEHFTGVHYVVVRQKDRALSVESLPHTTGSELEMSLTIDGMTATGSWAERTSPTGYYKGAVYRGAMQLLIGPSGARMTGRWLGFGKRFQINNGDWELTRESRSLSRRTLKSYELKA